MYEGEKGKGQWQSATPLPESWSVRFDDLSLTVRLSPYKHTGVFPEQRQNWAWMRKASAGRALDVLNLFAYTGAATVALAKDGHRVTHVDASRPAIGWARENAAQNGIAPDAVRWMLEDAKLFAAREVKRGKRYDAILLDPPAYGHAPDGGKAWRVERDLAPLLEHCAALLSDHPVFLLLNGYAQHDTPESFKRLLHGVIRTHASALRFRMDASELLLQDRGGRPLSTGTTVRCAFGGV